MNLRSLLGVLTLMVSAGVGPEKARAPVSISNSTQPNAQISVRRSISRPRICSGLM